MSNAKPKAYGVLLYQDFEVLDAAGPIEALNCLVRFPGFEDLTFSYVAKSKDVIVPGPSTQDNFRARQQYLPSHTFAEKPEIDVLIVPGGMGMVGDLPELQDYIRKAYRGEGGYKKLHSIISVCTGSVLMARSGILDGQRATGNKDAWDVVTSSGPKTHWIAQARWTNSENIWSTSGVSAGADGMLAWMEEVYGSEVVDKVVDTMEWIRAKGPEDDPFAVKHGCQDVLPQA
ncbi:hypothetical protein BAUCODRAFT_37898 [Baudoinia panamericana UAMH 10762]|uniref:DJ-1/PfpI domain-containing protein n=1 Tax=Baudoinia panamericana (strain UAMH 10762) TaxID=717646 RepID=M2N2W0_BAUPA|nr:uncharacterized protein BAUCODRAFT_37898 [Baudoinia panamericana UAMH 10762]EMC92990.1 hypothetical protein BAUCODRAFT_37898 [Baudoinia panamericana UAMH 10762]